MYDIQVTPSPLKPIHHDAPWPTLYLHPHQDLQAADGERQGSSKPDSEGQPYASGTVACPNMAMPEYPVLRDH